MARLRVFRDLALLAVLFDVGAARAQSRDEGIPVGIWLISPAFESEVSYDSNVGYETADESESDVVTELTGELRARLPFRKSYFDASYRRSSTTYGTSEFNRSRSEDLGVALTLEMSNGDQLRVRDTYSKDFIQLRDLLTDADGIPVDPSAPETFFGEPYSLNRLELQYDRAIQGQKGFMIRARRLDRDYDGEIDILFSSYEGLDLALEYRQPLPGGRWIVGHYNPRRFDFFLRDYADARYRYKTEASDTFQLGLMGQLGRDQPFVVRVGYGQYRYETCGPPPVGQSGSGGCLGRSVQDVNVLTGLANWIVRLGAESKMNFELVRSSYPTDDGTYYVYNHFRLGIERELGVRSRMTLATGLGRNRYPALGGQRARDDRLTRIDAEFVWAAHPRLELRVGASLNDQNSTSFQEYKKHEFKIGIATGWF